MKMVLVPVEELKTHLSDAIKEVIEATLLQSKEPFHQFPELLSREQVSEMLGVSIATVDNWSNEGRLQKHRIGSAVRFKKSEVLDSLQSLQKWQRA